MKPARLLRAAFPDWRVTSLVVACAILMEQMDATALPTMAHDFVVTGPAMSITFTSSLLMLAIFVKAREAR